DVGSGAGLPGIPLAILRPDLKVTLLEPLLRRVNFLELAVDELQLTGRVRVVRGRAEDHGRSYDVVTCRAVAPLPRLLGWCIPLLGVGGRLVALKGSTAADEVVQAAPELRSAQLKARVEELTIPGATESTWAIVVTNR
ncbi:MAG: 16S rRNA (guanine(527)-N(7))-methyltransferase RsmG, partial [Propionicimonas sp.]